MNDIDWGLWRSFLAVVEAGSLSAAATRSGATQPTLSRHVRELEHRLGMALFTRSAKGLEPTEAALRLMPDILAMGDAAQALRLRVQGHTQTLHGTVRITASVIMANLILPPVLVALRTAEPEIQIELVASDRAQNLLRRDADIAIRMFNPTQDTLIARKLGDAPINLFGTRSYFQQHGPIRTIDDLKHHHILGFDRSETIIAACAARGLNMRREDFPVRCDDQMVYWNLLLAGAGLGFAQTLTARQHPKLQAVELDLHLPPMPVWLVMHEALRTQARIRRVADFLAAALRERLGKHE